MWTPSLPSISENNAESHRSDSNLPEIKKPRHKFRLRPEGRLLMFAKPLEAPNDKTLTAEQIEKLWIQQTSNSSGFTNYS